MKSKILLSSLLSISAVISGCSTNNTSENKKETKQETKQEVKQDSNSNVTEDSILRVEELLKNSELNSINENDTFKVSVTGIKISKLFIKDSGDQRIILSKLEPNTEYTSILLRVKIENKLDRNLMINSNTSHLMVKSTKEQTEQNQYLSSWKETTFLPGAEKEQTLLFILKKSKLSDIKNITLHIDRPFETSNTNMYEPLSVEITNIQ